MHKITYFIKKKIVNLGQIGSAATQVLECNRWQCPHLEKLFLDTRAHQNILVYSVGGVMTSFSVNHNPAQGEVGKRQTRGIYLLKM